MKKIALSIIAALSLIFALASCNFTPGGSGGVNPGTDTKYGKIIIASDLDLLDFTDVRNAVFNLSGAVEMVNDEAAASEREIVFGNTNRAITAKAKETLEKTIEKSGAEVGYIIYASEGSVAVYWSYDEMQSTAVNEFIRLCVEEKKLKLEDGAITARCYATEEFLEERSWAELSEVAEADVYNALRELSEYYDMDKMLGWFANLWDDEIGAFYYSASARDNEPFLPDIESTNQAIGWMTNNNLLNSKNDLPNDIKLKIINFAKSMQSSSDGYFYHEQWPKGIDKLNVDRYGRDLSWATSIITTLTADSDGDGIEEKHYPNWCTPSGVKCSLHKDGGSCNFASATLSSGEGIGNVVLMSSGALTAGLCANVSAAVSRVESSANIVAVASAKPDYSSSAAFIKWLEDTNTNIKESSGNAQMINAQQDMIISRGYCDELLDFLDRIQEEIYEEQIANGETPSGLWQYSAKYGAVWGLLKYTPFYNDSKYGRELKYAEEIVATCLEVIMLPADGKFQANDIYNQWMGMQSLLNNVKKYNPDKLDDLYAMVRENASDYVENSIAKLEYFRSDEGSFSFLSTGCSQSKLYGTPMSLGAREGDVNATVLLCSMYRCMFSCMGYDVINLGNLADGERLIEIMRGLEPVVKNPMAAVETIDFEGEDPLGALKLDSQSGAASAVIKNQAYTIKGVVNNDSSNRVLKYNSAASSTSYGDGVSFTPTGIMADNCIIIETDICIASGAGNNDILQLRIGDFYRIRFNKSGNNIRLIEMLETTGATTAQTLTSGLSTQLKMGEWFRLRIECYKSGDDLEAPCFKIFINNQYVTTSYGAYGVNNNNIAESAATVLFRSYKSVESEIYLDNCFFHIENRNYDPDNHEIYDSRSED